MKNFTRRKSLKKGIIVFGLLLIIPLLLVIFNTRSNFFSAIKTNQLFFKEENIKEEYAEEKLYNHAKELSVTLLDSQGRIISSTNTEKEIDSIYQFSETTLPKKYITLEDTLIFLIEMNKFFDEEGNLLINNNTYYYLDIPSYIIPDDKAIVSTEDGNEIELFKSGKAKAFGGIFKEGSTGYRFKIRFENLEDITELNANFQFTLKLSNTIYNQVLDLKTLRMEDLNNLQFWVKKPTPEPPPDPEPYPYELTSSISKVNGTYQSNKYTVILKDKRPQNERKTKGTMTINFGAGIGMNWNTYNHFENIKIYLDNNKLQCSRKGNYVSSCGVAQGYGGGRIENVNVSISSFVSGLDYRYSESSSQQNCTINGSIVFACLVNGITISFEGDYGEGFVKVPEWKIEIDSELYTTKSGTFIANAVYNDTSDSITTPLVSNATISKYYANIDMYSSLPWKKEYGNTIEEFVHRVEIDGSSSNYVGVEVINNKMMSNNDGYNFSYYLNSRSFNYCGADYNNQYNNSTNSLDIYINGSRVSFSYGYYSLASFVAGQFYGDSSASIQKEMTEVLNNNYDYFLKNGSGPYIWKSSTKYNGKYIYVLIDPKTFETSYKNGCTGTGRGEYTEYEDLGGTYSSEKVYKNNPNFKMYIFNIEDIDVNIDFYYKLSEVKRIAHNNANGGSQVNEILTTGSINAGMHAASKKTGFGFAFDKYTSIQGERLNDGYIKWNVEISTAELEKLNINKRYVYSRFYIAVPSNQVFNKYNTNRAYYDLKEHRVKSANDVNTNNLMFGTDYLPLNNTLFYCESTIKYGNADSCSEYGGLSSFDSMSNLSYNNTYSVTNLLSTNGTSMFYAQQGNILSYANNGKIILSFFTREYYDSSNINRDDIYFQFTAIGGSSYSSYGNSVPFLYYTDKGSILNRALSPKKTNTGSYRVDNSGKLINTWEINELTYNSDYTNEYLSYLEDRRYTSFPYNNSINAPIFYRGSIEYTDKMEGIAADYTRIKKFDINLGSGQNISFSEQDINNLENKKCIGSGICVYFRYNINNYCRNEYSKNIDCLKSYYGNDYLNNMKKMSNGFNILITGIGERVAVYNVYMKYYTETDEVAMHEALSKDSGIQIDKYNYYGDNIIIKNDYRNSDPFYDYMDLSYGDAAATFYGSILADISISKDVKEEATDKYLSKDTTKNTLTAQIGYSAVPELDINDIIKSIGNSSSGTANDIEDIKELKKYLEIGNLSIKYYPGFSISPITIYSNNSFISDWSNSTITFDPNDSNLYSLHLENLGKTIPMGSKFEVSYDLTFDIDNYRKIENTSTNPQGIRNNTLNKNIKPVYLNNIDNNANIKLLENEKKILDSYRNNDNYSGGYFYIITDAEAIREYTPGPSEEEVTSTNPKNYVDKENHKLHVFNNATVYGKHLKYPSHSKMIATNSNNKYYTEYTITTNFGSTGKEPKATTELNDELQYSITVPEELVGTESEAKINQLNELILANTKITSFEVYKQISDSIITLYKHEEMLEPGAYNFSKDEYSGTIILHGNDHPNYLEITATGFEYDEKIYIKYGTMVDFEKFYKDAIDSNLLDTNLKIKGTDLIYEPTSTNVVRDPVHVLEASASSGYINIKASMPTINKRVEYPNETDAKWTVNVTTGYLNEVLKITDLLDIQGSEAIKKSIVTKDLQIKVNDTVVYENDSFVGDWGQNIKIDNLNFEFKNTDNNDFISKNSNIEISYITHFDVDKYRDTNGVKTDSYYINNEATLEKGYIKTKALATTKKLEFDYPLTISKTYIGNKDNDLEYTKWHYEVDSKDLNRKNVIISDNSELSSDFGKYLSISDLSIKLVTADKEEEIYNHLENKNALPQTIHITDIDGEELEFKKNGEYKFIIKLDTLEANTKVVVDYEFFIDREKYEYYEEPTDIELNINNNIKLDYDGETITTNDRGTSVISSPLSKKYRLINKTTTNVKMEWSIDINLDIDYPGELTDNDEVTIMDQLFGGTTYEENSIKVYNLVLNGTSYGQGSLLTKDTDYTFVYEEDTVKVKLLHPNNNKNIRIIFNTNSETIPDSLKNYVSMSVNGKSTYISSKEVSGAFTTFIGGTVTSRGVTYFTIYANKYLDDKLTNKEFEFELEEVDYDGNELTEGIKLKAVNDENGRITFGPIKYSNDGIHYYKIKEKKGSERIEYDENVYTVKIKVVNFQNEYVIEESSIIGKGEDEEIEFYNKTIPPEPEPEPEPEKEPEKEPDKPSNPSEPKKEEQQEENQTEIDSGNKDNPNTADPIKIILIILVILGVGIILIKKFKPTKYNQVS